MHLPEEEARAAFTAAGWLPAPPTDVIECRTLLAFTRATLPGYEVNWHHAVVADALDQVLAGTIRRLLVCLPPQNGKSELVSRRFPAFALGRDPELRLISCSYSAGLATDMSTDVQAIMVTPEYRQLFPGSRLGGGQDLERRTMQQFQIVGHRGRYRGAGVGGSITGMSADIGIIDDPVKNRAEAESETYRKNVWNWFTSTFSTRQFGDTGRMVIALTRWHEDDLAGKLLRVAAENPGADQWTVLTFPAIAEGDLHPSDPRAPGEPLWPGKYPLAELTRRRIGIGSYEWESLYQQRPVPPGGGMFKRAWFDVGEPPKGAQLRYCRAWDVASTESLGSNDPDYTVGTLMARSSDDRFWVVDVVRDRLSPMAVAELIAKTAKSDPKGTIIREEQEGGSAGKAVIATRARALIGYDYRGAPATGAKQTRWRPFAAQCEAQNVQLFPDVNWSREWLDEMAAVPYSRHDDQADSAALAFNTLALTLQIAEGEPYVAPHTSVWKGSDPAVGYGWRGGPGGSTKNPALGGE